MILSVRFADSVKFRRYNDYCICTGEKPHREVMISLRLKKIIDSKDWSQVISEDLEEIRSLRELGILVEEDFC